MHTAPLFEEHDTESDLDREDLAHRVVHRVRFRASPERETAQVSEPTQLPPPKRPIPLTEQLGAASVARLKVREAVVKRMSPSKPVKPETFRGVPDVRIAWVRSTDRALRIQRDGPDAFVVEGAAAENARVSVAIDGLIFTVAADAGESASAILHRLSARLELEYRIEALEVTPTRSAARLTL